MSETLSRLNRQTDLNNFRLKERLDLSEGLKLLFDSITDILTGRAAVKKAGNTINSKITLSVVTFSLLNLCTDSTL